MTGSEAHAVLLDLRDLLENERETFLAGHVEDILIRLRMLRQPLCRNYADLLLPPGRFGRVRLVLCRPYEARVYAFIAAILRSVE